MDEEEDVNHNPFFVALKQKYQHIFQQALNNRCIICVPQIKSMLVGVQLTENFIQLHILRALTSLQCQYKTLDGKSVEFESNSHLILGEDFAERRKIRVLSDETFYNSNGQNFRVLLIERPFEGGSDITDSERDILPKERTTQAVEEFLRSFPENEIVLQKIDETMEQFNNTYIIVKNFEAHVVRKVHDLFTYSLEALLCANPVFREFHNKNRNLSEFKEVLEVYVFNRLHHKLWESFSEIFAKEDSETFAVAASLHRLRQSDLGIRQELQCSMVEPSRKFKQIDRCHSPIEKIYCLKETSDLIMKTVANNISPGSDLSVTTDDLIPFLVYIIVLSKPKHMKTNLFFMENLTFINLSTSQMGFTLVSLQAAVQYLKSKELEKFKQPDTSQPNPLTSHANLAAKANNRSVLNASASQAPSPSRKKLGAFFFGGHSRTTSMPVLSPSQGRKKTNTIEKSKTYRISDLTHYDSGDDAVGSASPSMPDSFSSPPPFISSDSRSAEDILPIPSPSPPASVSPQDGHLSHSYSSATFPSSRYAIPAPSSLSSSSPSPSPSPSGYSTPLSNSGGSTRTRLGFRSWTSLFSSPSSSPSLSTDPQLITPLPTSSSSATSSSSSSSSSQSSSRPSSIHRSASNMGELPNGPSSSTHLPYSSSSSSAHYSSASSASSASSSSSFSHPSTSPTRSSVSRFLPSVWTKPPEVISTEPLQKQLSPRDPNNNNHRSNDDNELGDFLSQLQNIKDDALSSQSVYH